MNPSAGNISGWISNAAARMTTRPAFARDHTSELWRGPAEAAFGREGGAPGAERRWIRKATNTTAKSDVTVVGKVNGVTDIAMRRDDAVSPAARRCSTAWTRACSARRNC